MEGRTIYIFAGISGAVAVGMGAFGAHALRDLLEPKLMSAWEKAVLYQFIHTLGLLILPSVIQSKGFGYFSGIAYSWMIGIFLFSGSLYLMVSGSVLGYGDMKWLGPVTPFGGIAFIVGWVLLSVGAFKIKKQA